MINNSKFQLRSLNGYSWAIIVAYIGAIIAMQYPVSHGFLENFVQTLSLAIIMIFWCEQSAFLLQQPECNLKKIELFRRDLWLLSFSFFIASLISLWFAHNNSDVKSLWPVGIYFITLVGYCFSVIFSIIALFIKNHKIYTISFSCLIITVISLGNFLPHDTSLPLLGDVDTFFVITGLLLMVHGLVVIGHQITKFR